jgi:hypothetical protein
MKFIKRMDMRRASNDAYRAGGQMLGYGVIIGKRTFFGIVRFDVRMRMARRVRKQRAR